MDLFSNVLDQEMLSRIFGDAVSKEFLRTLTIFGFAAFVHGRQVSREIKKQFGLLVSVLQADLDAQKNSLGQLDGRVSKIEKHLIAKE